MIFENNKNLKEYNAFKTKVIANNYIQVNSKRDLKKLPRLENFFILGGGFNTLFIKERIKIPVIKINIKGIKLLKETKKHVYLEIGAGEDWIKLVKTMANKGLGGIENLAYIPGTIGSAVIQNIAAYGENFKDVFVKAKIYNPITKKFLLFKEKDCKFGYRKSIFKNPVYKNLIIYRVIIKLQKNPKINTNYFELGRRKNSIQRMLKEKFSKPYTVKKVYKTVVYIRKQKLPEPSKIPSAGSFFLNPSISKKKYKELRKEIPNLQWYPATDRVLYIKNKEELLEKQNKVKIATGHLLDVAGWKGKWIKNCSCYHKNASIVITNKKASGKEVYEFSRRLKKDIKSKFGINLKEEVIIVK